MRDSRFSGLDGSSGICFCCPELPDVSGDSSDTSGNGEWD